MAMRTRVLGEGMGQEMKRVQRHLSVPLKVFAELGMWHGQVACDSADTLSGQALAF